MANIKWGAVTAAFAVVVCIVLGIFSNVQAIHIFVRSLIFAGVFFGLGFGLRFVVDNFLPEILIPEDDSAGQEVEPPGSRVSIMVDSTGEYAVPELFKIPENSEELGNIEDLLSGAFRYGSAGSFAAEARKPEARPSSDQMFKAPLTEETIDRKKEAGYNDTGDFQSVFENPGRGASPKAVDEPAARQFSASFGDDSGLEGLPDLDMMARAFSSGGEAPISISLPPENSPPASFAGNFAEPTASSPSMAFVPSIPVFEEMEPAREPSAGNKPQTLEGDFDPKSLARGISTILSKG